MRRREEREREGERGREREREKSERERGLLGSLRFIITDSISPVAHGIDGKALEM